MERHHHLQHSGVRRHLCKDLPGPSDHCDRHRLRCVHYLPHGGFILAIDETIEPGAIGVPDTRENQAQRKNEEVRSADFDCHREDIVSKVSNCTD